ncbi:response regulator [Exiguobacterium flavidum]|uniref:response regulator n=1 Tax=Exiguobacterium flavidum TaxID=2184695 RepID=UPI001E5628C2|nr:response regulator transcription factor [Exiguobacterium flavidum]
MKEERIRLLIVDDHVLVRDGLRLMFENDPDIEVVGAAEEGGEAIRVAIRERPDVILLDVTMPEGLDGFVTARSLKEEVPEVRVIFLTMHDEEVYVRKALESGISGYLSKNSDVSALRGAIKHVYSGKTCFETTLPPEEIDRLLQGQASKKTLTRREIEIVRLTALGYTNLEIGNQLNISPKTVENHKARIMGKLQIKHKHELVQYALKNHLIGL